MFDRTYCMLHKNDRKRVLGNGMVSKSEWQEHSLLRIDGTVKAVQR